MKTVFSLMALAVILAACAAHPAGGIKVAEDGTPVPDVSRSKPDVQRYVKLGQQATDDGKPEVAGMMLQAAVNSAPDDPAPRLALAQLEERAGDEEQAAKIYDDLAGKAGKKDMLPLKLAAARAYLKAHKYDEAATRYEALTNNQSDSENIWRAYNGLGVVHDLQGNEPTAIRAYQTALEKAPADDKPKVRANLALSYILGHQPRQAIELLAPLEKNDTLSSTEKRYLALAYGFMGRVEEAQRLGLAEPPTYELMQQSLEAEGGPAVVAAPAGKVASEPVN